MFGEGNLSGALSNHSHELSPLQSQLKEKVLAITVWKTAKFANLDSELGKVMKAGSEKLVLTPGLFFEIV